MDIIDHHDFGKLLSAIIRQALDDYIKLQHPKYRQKKYLIEAWDQAVDMFFDDEYRFLAIQNDDGDDMSLRDMVKTALKSDRADIQKLRDYAIQEALEFWDNKDIKTLDIPETVQVSGHVYKVRHTEDSNYVIDFTEKILTLDKRPGIHNEERFINAVFEIMMYYEEIPIKKTNMKSMSKAWFRMLKVNNCFTGIN